MALYFDLTQPTGEVSRIELKPGSQRLRVLAGDRYRIIDEQGNTPAGLVIRRYDNHLLVDDDRSGTHVELTDYYGRCSISAPCVLELGAADGSLVQITPASEPIRAMTDGSFVLHQVGNEAGGIAPLAAPASTGGGDWSSDGGINGWVIGGGVLGLLAVAGLAGGGGGGSSPPVAVSPSPPGPTPPVPGDTTPPPVPEVISGTRSSNSHPVVIGKAEPGSTVQVSYDTNGDGSPDLVYRVPAGSDGAFVLDLATAQPLSGTLPRGGLPDGRVAVSVVAIDASNNASQPYSYTMEVSATPPDTQITGVTDNVGARTGPVSNGGGTDDLTPTLGGTLARPLDSGERLVILRNGSVVATLDTVRGTSWSYEDSGLAMNQTYVYEARVVNAAGNTSSTSNGWQIQTRADPAAPLPTVGNVSIVDDAPRYTGTIANGGVTNDRTPTINGELSAPLAPGQSLQVLRNGELTTLQASVTGTSFSVTDSLARDGTYTYAVRVVQADGATGTASAGYSMVLDTTNTRASAISEVTDNVRPDVGRVANGGSTNDTTPTLSGTVSGGLAAGERLEIVRDGQVVQELTTAPGGRWTWTDTGLVVGQTYSYQVRVVDAAGNVGPAGTAYRIRVVATPREDDPSDPTDPTVPVVDPTGPSDPSDPATPTTPTDPTFPGVPVTPIDGASATVQPMSLMSSPTAAAWLQPASTTVSTAGAANAAPAGEAAEQAAGNGQATPILLADVLGPGAGSAGMAGDGGAGISLPAAGAVERLLETPGA